MRRAVDAERSKIRRADSFATTLERGGTDLVIVAESLGHARLDATRICTRPSAEDRARALDLLPVDE
jgi:integrase/recombinase XerC